MMTTLSLNLALNLAFAAPLSVGGAQTLPEASTDNLSAQQSPQPEASAQQPQDDVLIVTGKRPERKVPERKVILGSRIARPALFSGYRFTASDTSLGGLTPGSGMDPSARYVGNAYTEETCTSDDPELTQESACLLIAARHAITAQDWPAAHGAVDRLESGQAGSATALYRAAQTRYAIASGEGDDIGRYFALDALLESGKLSPADKMAALRTRVAISLADGDDPAAIRDLQDLLAVAPDDISSLINLAGLYQRNDRLDQAAKTIRNAIAIRLAQGGDIPASWAALAGEQPQD